MITPGFNLPAMYIIHTVGPMFPGARDPVYQGEVNHDYGPLGPKVLLVSAFRSCLDIATTQGFKSIVFPAISCGVFGCPISVCAKVARQLVVGLEWKPLELIVFALYTPAECVSFVETWKMLEPGSE